MSKEKDNLGAEYKGDLTPLAVRRINKEKDQLGRETKDLTEQGIYFHFDESHSHKAVALIVGPGESPYSGGFYLFEFTFPNTYPLKPPHVKFVTGDNRVRFNPNLYVNGKVCLSILGTWQGPSWTAACTFRTTLFSIQSLLHNRPLQNEPGYENDAGKDCELYSSMLRYENVAVAVMQLARVPETLRPLRSTMACIFVRRIAEYLKVLDDFDAKEGKTDKCPLYGFATRYAPSEVRKKLAKLKESLLQDSELKDEVAKAMEASVDSSSSVAAKTDETVIATTAPAQVGEKRAAPSDDAAASKHQRVDA